MEHFAPNNLAHRVGVRNAAKKTLADKVNHLIDDRRLSQAEAGRVLGMPQSKVSAIRNYKLRGISMERLLQALTDLGQHVEIIVSPSTATAPARLEFSA